MVTFAREKRETLRVQKPRVLSERNAYVHIWLREARGDLGLKFEHMRVKEQKQKQKKQSV